MRYYIFCMDIGQFRAKDDGWVTKSLEEAEMYTEEAAAKMGLNRGRNSLHIEVVINEDEAIIRETMLS